MRSASFGDCFKSINGVQWMSAKGRLQTLPVPIALRGSRPSRGHADVRTAMIYTHAINKGERGVRKPLVGV